MRTPFRRSENFQRPKLDPHITEEKFLQLKNKLIFLKKDLRLRLMKEVATLAEMGDLSENAAYQIAKGKLRGINQSMLEIEHQIKKAVIIQPVMTSTGIQLGSHVTVKINGIKKTYTILGSSEVDPLNNIISHNSPLGVALIGKQVGDSFDFYVKNSMVKGEVIGLQ
jgi:transcription elongation factor GreA